MINSRTNSQQHPCL